MAVIYTDMGNGLVKAESDEGKILIQDGTGIEYYSAVDPAAAGRTYTESDKYIDDEIGRHMSAERLLDVITGGQGV